MSSAIIVWWPGKQLGPGIAADHTHGTFCDQYGFSCNHNDRSPDRTSIKQTEYAGVMRRVGYLVFLHSGAPLMSVHVPHSENWFCPQCVLKLNKYTARSRREWVQGRGILLWALMISWSWSWTCDIGRKSVKRECIAPTEGYAINDSITGGYIACHSGSGQFINGTSRDQASHCFPLQRKLRSTVFMLFPGIIWANFCEFRILLWPWCINDGGWCMMLLWSISCHTLK